MTEPTQPQDSSPWYIKGVIDFGHAFGVSAVLLAFYLLQSAGVIPNPVEKRLGTLEDDVGAIKAMQQQNAGAATLHDASTKDLIKAIEQESRARLQERQKWCVLKAKTDDEKRACFTGGEGGR
jgi:hypothetical protein